VIKVKKLKREEISKLVDIYLDCFHGMKDPILVRKWFECNFKAFPRMQYFVAQCDDSLVGYILWMEKGGFREEAVLELEQIGVSSTHRGKGIGTILVEKSLEEMKKYLESRGSRLKLVEVTTGTDNKAQRLYEKTMGAKVECIIKNLFRGDEAIMIARYD